MHFGTVESFANELPKPRRCSLGQDQPAFADEVLRGKRSQIGSFHGDSIRDFSGTQPFPGMISGRKWEWREVMPHEDHHHMRGRCSLVRLTAAEACPVLGDGMLWWPHTANTDLGGEHCVPDKMCSKPLSIVGGNTAHHLREGIANSTAGQIQGIYGGTFVEIISSEVDQRYFLFDRVSLYNRPTL
jgi:hypothetical protein